MHEITLVTPFPAGEGGRGDRGQKSKLKAGAAGDKEGKPPPGTANARRASNAGGTPPLSLLQRQVEPVPPGFSPGGCKGRSPLHKKTKNLPLPRWGRGSGG